MAGEFFTTYPHLRIGKFDALSEIGEHSTPTFAVIATNDLLITPESSEEVLDNAQGTP